MNEKRYQVEAIRSGAWWAIEFPAVDDRIHSQARRLDQVPEMAAAAIVFSFEDEGLEVSPDQIDVRVQIPDELEAVKVARELRDEAAHAQERAQDATRAAAIEARAAGLTVRDIGGLLGVSHAYAARLVKEDAN